MSFKEELWRKNACIQQKETFLKSLKNYDAAFSAGV